MLPDDTRVVDDATPAAPVGGIYIIRLSDTHYYGGRTGNFKKRWADHHRELREGRHNNRRMQRVFDIHGRFDPDVVRVLSPDECVDAEQTWLDENFRKPGCVNISPFAQGGGGMLGHSHTPETIEQMRVSARRRAEATPTTHGDGTRALISSQQRGREWVNDGTVNRRVWPDEAAALVSAGWVRGKLGGSVAGMVWMFDPTGRRRRVRPGEVDARLSDGWTHPPPAAGYVPVSDSRRGHRGTVWVRRRVGDDWECRRVPDGDVDGHLADGWERGARPASGARQEAVRAAWSDPAKRDEARARRRVQENRTAGTVWLWRDGDGFRRAPVDEVSVRMADGWVRRGPRQADTTR